MTTRIVSHSETPLVTARTHHKIYSADEKPGKSVQITGAGRQEGDREPDYVAHFFGFMFKGPCIV